MSYFTFATLIACIDTSLYSWFIYLNRSLQDQTIWLYKYTYLQNLIVDVFTYTTEFSSIVNKFIFPILIYSEFDET